MSTSSTAGMPPSFGGLDEASLSSGSLGSGLAGGALDPRLVQAVANALFHTVDGDQPTAILQPIPTTVAATLPATPLGPIPGCKVAGLPGTTGVPISDPIGHIGFPQSLFDNGPNLPFGSSSPAQPTRVAPSASVPDRRMPPIRRDPSSASHATLGAALSDFGGAGEIDPLHPDMFGALANQLFRGVSGGQLGETAMPPGMPTPASHDPLRPDVFAKIANSLFQGPTSAMPASTPAAAAPATAHAPTGSAAADSPSARLDINQTAADFPILQQKVHGKRLVWLDNAATTQKPKQVVERVRRFYYEDNSNVHRGAHTLAARATDAYEEARTKIARFLGAGSEKEIVFVRGTTEAINLVANSYGRLAIGDDDEIILSELEHHSNIVPWQFLAQRTGARLRVAKVDDDGNLRMDDYAAMLNRRTRIVAMTQVSNAIGTVMPVTEITAMAHRVGARVLIDGAQSVQHMPVNLQEIGCDFFCLSGHKIFGPTGIGVLYGRSDLLEHMPPWQGGGSMIESVTFEQSVFAPVPAKFEAGTPILAGAVGLGAAVDYVSEVGLPIIARHEHVLMDRLVHGLSAFRRVRIVGNPKYRAGALSFVVDGMEASTVGALLDMEGIAVRAGHHCAQPALAHFGLKASVRPSFALYNTVADVDALLEALERIIDNNR